MPGKKGQKMIARLSTSKKFHSVKELVFSLFEKDPTIAKEEVEKIIKKEYPHAAFLGHGKRSGHYSWYKHRWNRMKLENANFNIKESHPKEKVEEHNESASHEGKKDRTTKVKTMGKKSMAKGSNRRKGGRIQIQSKKRKVVVKARKASVQRNGSTEGAGQNPEDQKVSD